jgi:hypothetical protein
MNTFKIKTTAHSNEDLIIVTTLTFQDIIEVVNPIVMAERDGYESYNNDTLIKALKKRYPSDTIENLNKVQTITI